MNMLFKMITNFVICETNSLLYGEIYSKEESHTNNSTNMNYDFVSQGHKIVPWFSLKKNDHFQ